MAEATRLERDINRQPERTPGVMLQRSRATWAMGLPESATIRAGGTTPAEDAEFHFIDRLVGTVLLAGCGGEKRTGGRRETEKQTGTPRAPEAEHSVRYRSLTLRRLATRRLVSAGQRSPRGTRPGEMSSIRSWLGSPQPMAYEEKLAERVREMLAEKDGIAEKKMFGGLAFLLNGNMAVAASGRGGLLVRVDPTDSEALTSLPHVELMQMRGRTMTGWIAVEPEALRSKRELAGWVRRGVDYAKRLPSK